MILIVAAGSVLHAETGYILFVAFLYGVCDYFDRWYAKRAKAAAIAKGIADVMDEWEFDPDAPAWENKGKLKRIKLAEKEQIVVARVAELLWKTLR